MARGSCGLRGEAVKNPAASRWRKRGLRPPSKGGRRSQAPAIRLFAPDSEMLSQMPLLLYRLRLGSLSQFHRFSQRVTAWRGCAPAGNAEGSTKLRQWPKSMSVKTQGPRGYNGLCNRAIAAPVTILECRLSAMSSFARVNPSS